MFESYKRDGLEFKKTPIHLELDLPWLAEDHDPQMIQISRISKNQDSEKLKFYLLALTKKELLNIFFDQDRTKAVALFREPLGNVIHCRHFSTYSTSGICGLNMELILNLLLQFALKSICYCKNNHNAFCSLNERMQ